MSKDMFMRYGYKGALLYEESLEHIYNHPDAKIYVYDISEPYYFGAIYPDTATMLVPIAWFPAAERRRQKMQREGSMPVARIQLKGSAAPASAPPARVKLAQRQSTGLMARETGGSNPLLNASPIRVALKPPVVAKPKLSDADLTRLVHRHRALAEAFASKPAVGEAPLRVKLKGQV